ncbi:MAG: alpha/beta fold hydrolase [Desulfovibrio sp.]|jgi:pimeloyl-ACP methyl ester carboxylesterase|nr:alpha/beta fold hydrolase [Desulfovibrio sp.]
MFVLKVLLYAAAALILSTACTGTLLFRYEAANAAPSRIPPPRGGAVSCILQFLRTLPEYALCLGLLPFGPLIRRFCERKLPPGAEEKGRGLPPLVFVHGIYNNASCWLYLAHVLRNRGFRVRFFTYSSSETLETVAADLDAFLRRRKLPGEKPPLLVAHSMGGLVARLFLLGEPTGACGLITLGTPHAGSKSAALLAGTQARSLTPGSEILQRLARSGPPEIPCVSLAATLDQAVLPPASLEPPEGWRLRIIGSAAGHYSMLFCPATAADLLQEADRIAAPDAGDRPA